jgi:hypothetical protein
MWEGAYKKLLAVLKLVEGDRRAAADKTAHSRICPVVGRWGPGAFVKGVEQVLVWIRGKGIRIHYDTVVHDEVDLIRKPRSVEVDRLRRGRHICRRRRRSSNLIVIGSRDQELLRVVRIHRTATV